MKNTILSILILASSLTAAAQGESNIWMNSDTPLGGTHWGLDFNITNPVGFNYAITNPPLSGISASNAICNAAGAPLFYTNGRQVFTNTGQLMPNGNNLIYPNPGATYSMPPLIVPKPKSQNEYYIFTLKDGGLFYNLIDMTLNNGKGDVVANKKNISMNAFAGQAGILVTSKMAAVKGCGSVWIVVRSKNVNQYRSYEITDTGINLDPVISACGLLPLQSYHGPAYPGVLKASPDGRKLAVACNTNQGHYIPTSGTGTSGIELYNFDPFTGIVSNPVLLDTPTHYYGVCFSPDNTKLYVSTFWDRKLYQYDVTLPTPAAILASKTLILQNPAFINNLDAYSLGDIKAGPDGKLYIGNNITFNQPGTSAYHVINLPNLPGLACTPALSQVLLPPGCFTGIDLPPDIVIADNQNSIISTHTIISCFRDSMQLTADTGKHYRWSNSGSRSIFVKQSGNYIVTYTGIDCNIHYDTFLVTMTKHVPTLDKNSYSCPGVKTGKMAARPYAGDTTTFTYIWKDYYLNIIRTHIGNAGDSIPALDTGSYYLQVTTSSGCDTTLSFKVLSLPVPVAGFRIKDIACTSEEISVNNTSPAPLINWYYKGKTSTDKEPAITFTKTGSYNITQVVTNLEGCKDTTSAWITIKDFDIQLSSDKELVDLHSLITLRSSASESYTVLSWHPVDRFLSQTVLTQSIQADTFRTYTVIGRSSYGCVDSASVTVSVRPVVFFPSVFSPNGDGRNDRFRPIAAGAYIIVRYFNIYDRWGKLVWAGLGREAIKGWDGTYNGTPAELGTYFYTINIETPTGETIQQKGNVTLIR